MLEELEHHGYTLSPGMLYPLLHAMESKGLLSRDDRLVEGKIRKYYRTTPLGAQVLREARVKAQELLNEIVE